MTHIKEIHCFKKIFANIKRNATSDAHSDNCDTYFSIITNVTPFPCIMLRPEVYLGAVFTWCAMEPKVCVLLFMLFYICVTKK